MEKKSNFLFLHLLPSLSPYSTFYGNSFLGATFLHTMMLMMIALPFVSLFLNLWLSPPSKNERDQKYFYDIFWCKLCLSLGENNVENY